MVGNAGTINTGAVDDLNAIADLCRQEELWLHVDGAIGGVAILAENIKPLLTGIERAEWSPAAVAAALARRGAGAGTAAELRAVLEEIERLRYSAAGVHRGAVPGILRRAEELWKNLERELQ